MRTVLLQSYYLGNDCGSVKDAGLGRPMPTAAKRASEEELQILANCYLRQKDTGGYVNAIEKLVVHYPKKEYWTDLLSRVQKKPGFSDRLGVNVYRLRFATGNLKDSQRLHGDGAARDAGGRAGRSQGRSSTRATRPARSARATRPSATSACASLIEKTLDESQKNRAQDEQEALAAKDGNALVRIGLNYVYEGNAAKGFPLIEQGIKKGGLKRPEDAKLRLGEALLHAGQQAARRADAARGEGQRRHGRHRAPLGPARARLIAVVVSRRRA